MHKSGKLEQGSFEPSLALQNRSPTLILSQVRRRPRFIVLQDFEIRKRGSGWVKDRLVHRHLVCGENHHVRIPVVAGISWCRSGIIC